MDFGILGPLFIKHGQTDLTPSASKPRKVVALLLLEPNTMVSTETIARELWEGNPPRSAVSTLQTYIFQVRKALRADAETSGRHDRLVTTPLGYLLRVRPDELDLQRFEQRMLDARSAMRRGDDPRAAVLLHEGLALWRGPALCDVRVGPILGIRALQLAERRLNALQLRIAADLRLGRHQALVSELRALAAEHPYHEALHAQLMLTLYRARRRPDALETYRRLRATLIDDLGLDPSAEVQRLHDMILHDDSLALDHLDSGQFAAQAV
jgi:DNA-binding SARP family transcriptional activator